jgi:AraC-like DNA-binding protein
MVNMKALINILNHTLSEMENHPLPFSVYSSTKEQNLLNVPVIKPLLIAVLSGDKELGKNSDITCTAGQFVFLSNTSAVNMRNIPKQSSYFALLIEFDYQDFDNLQINSNYNDPLCIGDITNTFDKCLQQFIEWSTWAPQKLWPLRRKEIIQLMCHMGHQEILSMVTDPSVSHRVHALFSEQLQRSEVLTVEYICNKLAMSESTLRRKLKSQGTTIQEIKDQATLGLGLHLLQSTHDTIGLIAEKCGYQSQSRFTERFKGLFGLTPSELRKTRLTD